MVIPDLHKKYTDSNAKLAFWEEKIKNVKNDLEDIPPKFAQLIFISNRIDMF